MFPWSRLPAYHKDILEYNGSLRVFALSAQHRVRSLHQADANAGSRAGAARCSQLAAGGTRSGFPYYELPRSPK